MSPMFVCSWSCGRHVCLCLSVTKRHKAHLKRLERRWTLGGVISRQQSRGEPRQMLCHLPPLSSLIILTHPLPSCYCSSHPVLFIVSGHMAQLVSLHTHAHICLVQCRFFFFTPWQMHLSWTAIYHKLTTDVNMKKFGKRRWNRPLYIQRLITLGSNYAAQI